MSKQAIEIKKFSPIITGALREVLLRRNAVWGFLKTEHSASDIKGKLEDERSFGAEIATEVVALLDYQKVHPAHTVQVDALLERYEAVNGYMREIQEYLNRDLEQKQREADAKKFDWAKIVSTLIGIPGIFVTAVKNGVGHGHISVEQAMLVGSVVSIPTAFHKPIGHFFAKAAKGVCAAPQIIKNDFHVFHAREVFRERTHAAQLCFAAAAKAINDNVAEGMRRTTKLGNIFGRRGPQP